MNEQFQYQGRVHKHRNYHDYEFQRGNPKELFTITFDSDDGSWFGTVMYSKTTTSAFGDAIALEQSVVDSLVPLIPVCDKPIFRRIGRVKEAVREATARAMWGHDLRHERATATPSNPQGKRETGEVEYEVEYEATLCRTVGITATSMDEALEKADAMMAGETSIDYQWTSVHWQEDGVVISRTR